MSHHDEPLYLWGDQSKAPKELKEQMDTEKKERKESLEEIARFKKQHSHATQAMFTEYVRMYNEIKSMQIDPVWLAKAWEV